MRLVAVILIFLGLYVLIEWGILGKDPWSSVTKTASAAAGNFGSGGTSPGSSLPSSLFGFLGSFSGFGESVSAKIRQADQAGLISFGGGQLAHDFDWAVNAGTPVTLPGGSGDGCYTYLGNETGGWGNLLGFKTPNGGVIEFVHFSQVAALTQGRCYPGGTQIGLSGGRPGIDVPDPSYSSGAHVAVITDTKGLSWLNRLLLPAGLQHQVSSGVH